MNRRIFLVAAVALFAYAGNTRAASQDKEKKVVKPVPSFAAAQSDTFTTDEAGQKVTPATTDPAYIIGPEDMIDVNVWKEPDMTRMVPVRPDGKYHCPSLTMCRRPVRPRSNWLPLLPTNCASF
jgi:hypothetical protein